MLDEEEAQRLLGGSRCGVRAGYAPSVLAHEQIVEDGAHVAVEAARVDEGLEQKNRMPERLEPIGAQASLAQSEDARSNVWTMPGAATRNIGSCSPAGASAHTAADSSSRSSGRGRKSSMRPPRSSAAPPAPRASSPRTTASRQSSPAPRGSGAPASAPGSVRSPRAAPAAPGSL